jgi:hypothetical protein
VLGGCAASHTPPLVIEARFGPSPGSDCVADAPVPADARAVYDLDPTGELFRASGASDGYVAVVLVSTTMTYRFERPLGARPVAVYVLSSSSTVTRLDGSSPPGFELPLARRPAHGVVEFATREGRGRGFVAVELLTHEQATALLDGGDEDVTVTVRVHGRGFDDSVLTSTPLRIDLHLCRGCLYACAPAERDVFVPCNPGQDDVTLVPSGIGSCP